MDGGARWETHAEWWQREYTNGADIEYEEQIIPLVAEQVRGAATILDVGCGEGQVARRLAAEGATVVGVDPSHAQVSEATARGGGPMYARARAEGLPYRDCTFDAAVACLALEHVDALDTAVAEMARVLVVGGRLLILIGHPLLQAPGSGWIDDQVIDERYWRIGEYLREHTVVDEVAPGVEFTFIHRPVYRYVNALGAAGLFVDGMIEPSPPARFLELHWGYPEADTIPRVLAIRARRVA